MPNQSVQAIKDKNKYRTWTLVIEAGLNLIHFISISHSKTKKAMWDSTLIAYSLWHCKWGFLSYSKLAAHWDYHNKSFSHWPIKMKNILRLAWSHKSLQCSKSRIDIINYPISSQESISQKIFNLPQNFYLFPPTPKPYLVHNVENNNKEKGGEKNNTTC